MMLSPEIVLEEKGFVAVYKPPGMHTVPLRAGEGGSLLDYCLSIYPEIAEIRGKKAVEGGMIHRLDRDTRGLVLAARTQAAYDSLTDAQSRGCIVKRYGAMTALHRKCGLLPGFPPVPAERALPFCLESGFRPYGPGRRSVRPVPRCERRLYSTSFLESEEMPPRRYFVLEIRRGFRHQIRCHLAWLGFPIIGDALYGGGGGALALKAQGIYFTLPGTSREIQVTLPPVYEDTV
jgi:23S rRNA pseudouridine1911/1915/1917 synthase